MLTDLLIRGAEPSDLAAVAELSRSLAIHVQDPDPGSCLESLLAAGFASDPWFECHVAIIAENIVGFVLFCRRFEAHTRQRSLWIGDLITSETVRGRGVGAALIETVHVRARELGATAITFEVWRENRSALAFYKRLGAEMISDRPTLLLTRGLGTAAPS